MAHLGKSSIRTAALLAATLAPFVVPALLTVERAQAQDTKPLPSPPADANVTLGRAKIAIQYNRPSMRGRKVMGGLVPYGKIWRTGANPATMFRTSSAIKVGDKEVPAGAYTLYTLPSENAWTLILNNQTGQWGTVYNQDQDFARIPLEKRTLPSPQERMSISFENTQGDRTELHIKWETTDVYVPVSASR